jgi:hypothetical protein
MDDDVSKLPYMEVQHQLQILEHIAQKGPLSQDDLTLQRELEAREQDLILAKRTQSFEAAPRSADGLDNREAWKKAAEYQEFEPKAEALVERHLHTEAQLADKRQKDIQKFGPSAELDAVHAGEQKLEARRYDEERGRFAREFLAARELKEQLEEDARQRGREPGPKREL